MPAHQAQPSAYQSPQNVYQRPNGPQQYLGYQVPQPVPPGAYQTPAGYPGQPGQPAPRRAGEGLPHPVRYDVMPGTAFGLALLPVPPTSSGPAAASLVTGIGSILVSLVVGCFAALGASGGWGPAVAGAFALLALFAGVAALVLGRLGLRQVAAGGGSVKGRGAALAGLICGGVGIGFTGLAFVLAVAVAQG